MNLRDAITAETLSRPVPKDNCPCDAARVSATQIARHVFATAEEQGAPFQGQTYEQWQKKWLGSKEFVLMDIVMNQVAVPMPPLNKNKVLEYVKASATSLAPIVVDVNKQQVGRTPTSGYVPPVIVVDGKHKYVAAKLQGRARVRAWVGMKALRFLTDGGNSLTIAAAAASVQLHPQTTMDVTLSLYAGMGGTPIPRQDVGDGGSQPTMKMPSVKSTGKAMEPYTKGQKPEIQSKHSKDCDCAACSKKMKAGKLTVGAGGGAGGAGAGAGGGTGGAGGMGQSGLNPTRVGFESSADPSDTKSVVDPSDTKYPPDPSDRKMGKYPEPQTSTGKCETNDTESDGFEHPKRPVGPASSSPFYQSPGSGVGPRQQSSTGATGSDLSRSGKMGQPKPKGGATRSDLSRVMNSSDQKGAALKVDKMWQKKKKMEAVAPPGFSESDMHKLKRKYGTTSAFKVAWSIHKDKTGKRRQMESALMSPGSMTMPTPSPSAGTSIPSPKLEAKKRKK